MRRWTIRASPADVDDRMRDSGLSVKLLQRIQNITYIVDIDDYIGSILCKMPVAVASLCVNNKGIDFKTLCFNKGAVVVPGKLHYGWDITQELDR